MVARALRLLFEKSDLEVRRFGFPPLLIARRRKGAHKGDHLTMQFVDFNEGGAAGAGAAHGAEAFLRVESRVPGTLSAPADGADLQHQRPEPPRITWQWASVGIGGWT